MATSLAPHIWAVILEYQLPHLGMTELLDRHRRVMGNDAPLFYDEPLKLVKGEGVWLEDVDGR